MPDSDEEDKVASPPRRPPVFRGKDAPPLVIHPDADAEIPKRNKSPQSSEYDYDFEFDDAELDRAEKEAFSSTAVTSEPTLATSRRQTSVSSSNTLGEGGSVPPVAGSSTQTRAERRANRRQPLVYLGSITIDDNEPDEKENVPVPTRHIRRRVTPSQPDPEDIIEISD